MKTQTDIRSFHNRAKAIAKHLEGSWKYNKADSSKAGELWPSVRITRDDGLELVLCTDTTGRVEISQPYRCNAWVDSDGETVDPLNYTPYGNRLQRPKITVSPTKTDERIARDISRRLIADCEEHHATAMRIVKERNAGHDEAAATAAAISIEDTKDRHGDYEKTFGDWGSDEPRATAKVSGTKITMKLDDVTPKQAKKILKLLNLI